MDADAHPQGRDRGNASESISRAAENAMQSHKEGPGTRQFGSRTRCQVAIFSPAISSHSAIVATKCQPVKIARNPMGTTNASNGTTMIFAEKPDSEMRWK